MNDQRNHNIDPVESGRRANILRRTAKEVRSYNVQMKILAAALVMLVALTSIF